MLASWLGLALGPGCGGDDTASTQAPEPPAGETVALLGDADYLLRVSMALRGTRPSAAELDAYLADPTTLPATVDAWMTTPEFEATVQDLFAELLLLRTDTTYQLPVKGILADKGYSQGDLYTSTTQAPLELISSIVMADEPYANVFTADYTLTDAVVADIYGLAYDYDLGGWQRSHWTDGRPQSGLLSDSEVWRRWVSNAANYHRGRANFISRTFLCEDIGARDVAQPALDLNDPAAVAAAVANPDMGCPACHDTLDPLAAVFWGYKEQLKRNAVDTAYAAECTWDYSNGEPPRGVYKPEHFCYPLRFYDISEQGRWADEGLKPPSWYGEPIDDMTDLGFHLVEDSRFDLCTARTVFAYLNQVERLDVPLDIALDLQAEFRASGQSLKTLFRSVVLSDEFRSVTRLDPESTDFVAGLLPIRPEQVDRTFADLTGFTWVANGDDNNCSEGVNLCWNTINLSNSDLYGFRSLMGGVDGFTVTHPTHGTTPTKVLALSKLAAEASGWVVDQDFAVDPASRKLLSLVEATTADEATIRAQLSALHWRLYVEDAPPDSPAVDASYALFTAVLARTGDPTESWKTTLTGMLQDPRMLLY